MRETTVLLASLACLTCLYIHHRSQPARPVTPDKFAHLIGWQKIFGLIAVILAILILINPDFFALGLLGDTTFFDVLVLALSVQMLFYVQRAWRGVCVVGNRSLRWMRILGVGLRYALAMLVLAFGSVMTAIQKAMHRIIS